MVWTRSGARTSGGEQVLEGSPAPSRRTPAKSSQKTPASRTPRRTRAKNKAANQPEKQVEVVVIDDNSDESEIEAQPQPKTPVTRGKTRSAKKRVVTKGDADVCSDPPQQNERVKNLKEVSAEILQTEKAKDGEPKPGDADVAGDEQVGEVPMPVDDADVVLVGDAVMKDAGGRSVAGKGSSLDKGDSEDGELNAAEDDSMQDDVSLENEAPRIHNMFDTDEELIEEATAETAPIDDEKITPVQVEDDNIAPQVRQVQEMVKEPMDVAEDERVATVSKVSKKTQALENVEVESEGSESGSEMQTETIEGESQKAIEESRSLISKRPEVEGLSQVVDEEVLEPNGKGVSVETKHQEPVLHRNGREVSADCKPSLENCEGQVPLASPEKDSELEKGTEDVFQMDSAKFLHKDIMISQACRDLIRNTYFQQSKVEFGRNVAKRRVVLERGGKKRPPMGPIVSLERSEHCDIDQLWEELELRNVPLLDDLQSRLKKISAAEKFIEEKAKKKAKKSRVNQLEEQKELDEDADEVVSPLTKPEEPDSSDSSEEVGGNSDDESGKQACPVVPAKKLPKQKKVTFDLGEKTSPASDRGAHGASGGGIEDGFFSIADMELFADDAEQLALAGKLMSDEENSDGESSDGDRRSEAVISAKRTAAHHTSNPQYSDFFDPPAQGKLTGEADKGQRVSHLLGAEDDSDDDILTEDPTPLSASQARTRKLSNAIEDENVAKKPWQLRGEVTGSSRPKNSLLDATMTHDVSGKVSVVIDEDRNETIEDILRQRITDRLFDDVVPQLSEEYLSGGKKKKDSLPEVSQEKAKESLADIYEKEFLGEKETVARKSKSAEVQIDESDAENAEQQEVNKLYKKLATKLDALSGLHFSPKAPKEYEEMAVKPSVRAIAAEEAIPEAVSDVGLLTPKQAFSVEAKELKGEKEKTKVERRAERSRAKASTRKATSAKARALQLMQQANPGQAEKRRSEAALLRRGKKIKVAQGDGFMNKSALSLGKTASKPSSVNFDDASKQQSKRPSASSLVM